MKPVWKYCTENNIDFTYKKPDGDTDYARIAMIDVAVAEGYNIIVMPGYILCAGPGGSGPINTRM